MLVIDRSPVVDIAGTGACAMEQTLMDFVFIQQTFPEVLKQRPEKRD
jgi:hypothetical protein